MKKLVCICFALSICQLGISQVTHVFLGNGNWTTPSNWQSNTVPPAVLSPGDTIQINPAAGDSCILNTTQTILPGAVLVVSPGAKFILTGNLSTYPKATLCGIEWSARNLDVSTYSNGDLIPHVTDPVVWATLNTGAWCWYNNDSATYGNLYGKLYNWYAVTDSRGLAPAGWHTPSYEEWSSVVSCSGWDTLAGRVLKDTGLWNLPNTGANNSTGFSARPGGVRGLSGGGEFSGISTNGYWWAPRQSDTFQAVARYRKMNYNNWHVDPGVANKTAGLSVRFIKNRLATITTSVVSSISFDSAVCGGNITNDGGIPITERGICWSVSADPNIQNNRTVAGIGTGSFIATMKPLAPKTLYYVRAYALNAEGIIYGQQRQLTSDSVFLKTALVTSIAGDSALSGGNIVRDAGLAITERGICWSNNPHPTVQNNRNIHGTGTGEFVSVIRGLLPNTTYYVRAYAVSSLGVSYAQQRQFTSAVSTGSDSIFIDPRDGQAYTYRRIGNQTWMTKNLNYVTPNSWCYDERATNCDVYGRLYYWQAALAAVPDGWHLPSVTECKMLGNYLGMSGGKMKSIALWNSPNADASNLSGFNALPGGLRNSNTTFNYLNSFGMWWNSTEKDSSQAYFYQLFYNSGTFGVDPYNLKTVGHSVRCIKNELPVVVTDSIWNITQNTALSGGTIINTPGASITARGVCWSTTKNPDISGNKTIDLLTDSFYTSTIAGLLSNTTYYVRAYATNSFGTGYGDEMSFTTFGPLPQVTTYYFQTDTIATVTCGVNVIDEGSTSVIKRGVCWSLSPLPTIDSDTIMMYGTGAGFESRRVAFAEATTYYLRAFAQNEAGISYGEQKSFTTINGPAFSITFNNISFNAITITCLQRPYTGSTVILSKGICFSTAPNPITDDNLGINGAGTTSFAVTLSGLTPKTLYYIRSFSVTAYGISYGKVYSVVTPAAIPMVSTSSFMRTYTSFTIGGTVTANGTAPVTARGVCWGILPNPDINDSVTLNGSGVGTFSSTVTGLQAGTTYYARAYAVNSGGVAYGNNATVPTLSYVPTLSITTIPVVGQSTLTVGANVNTQGETPVTQRGICWSTSPLPDILNDKTDDGAGTGGFTSNITGLQPGTTYYARAYASNSRGTGYSQQFSFTTLP